MTKAIDAAFLPLAPVVGYYSALLLLEPTKNVLASIGLAYPGILGLLSGFGFVVVSSYVFLISLAYFTSRETSSYAYGYSIGLVCLLLAGLLVRMSATEGAFTTVGFLAAYVAVLGLAVVTGFPGWNVSLMLIYNVLCMLFSLPLIYGVVWLLNASVVY